MAVSYLFDTVYSPKNVGTGAKHRLVIGTTETISGVATQLELLDPGIKLQWQGDAERFNKAVMGSTLSFTAYVNDNQLTKWENLLNQNEGKCFCLFFDSDAADAKPYWYGSLLIESTSIEVACERRKIDVVFTDGLAMLRGAPWVKANGDAYTGRKTLAFYMNEIVSKLGGFAGYKDYMNNEINQTVIPKFREIGFPWPSVENHDDETFYDWHEADGVLEHCAVESRTFHKPKKNVDRLRELAARPEYFNTGDVLEDICKAFGATACMFEGRVNLVCRQEVAFMKGAGVYGVKYDKNTSSPFNDVVSADTTGLFGTEGTNFDDHYVIRAGATKGKSLPFSQAILIHEDGGSDNLVQQGFFDPRGGAETGGRPNIFSDSLGHLISNTGYRADVKYVFDEVPINIPDNLVANPTTGHIIEEPYLTFPKDPSTYMGFPSQEATDLEVFSGEQVRLTFGGNVEFRHVSSPPPNVALGRNVFGSHMVVRVRLQFTTTGDVGYRASRTVQTHVLSNGSADSILIDFGGLGTASDRRFFRKLYNNFAWIEEGSAGYDDAFYEILVPHGDTNNTGDGYGATVHPLTVQYAGQTPYAPIGTKIQGEDDGTGVILDRDVGTEHMYHYFREDIQLELPFAANDTILSFEKCYFEQGASLFEPENGPNPNTTAQNDGSPDFDGTTPLWRSANADGTGGSKVYSTGAHWMSKPKHLHFVGVRVAIGDGSDTADITTKMTGGDGYEIFAMGSSRIGSRTTFFNKHTSGTVFAPMKESAAENDFSIVSGAKVFKENIKWKGHAHGETNASPDTFVDSLHSYVADTHLKLLGESADIYTLSAMPRPGSNPDVVKSPFAVFKTDQLETSTTVFLMPLNLNWASNQGFSGTFLKVGQARDLSTIQELDDPVRRGGPSQDGGGGGGIVGMTGVIERINTTRTSLNTTNAAVAVNTAKVGITAQQATDITNNNAKVGITAQQASEIQINTAKQGTTLSERQKLAAIDYTGGAISGFNFGTNTNVISADAVETDADRQFVSSTQAANIAANKTKTDLISVTNGGIDSFNFGSNTAVIEAGLIDQSDPDFQFVTLQAKNQIGTDSTARTTANAAKAKTDLISVDSEGITGFTVGDGVTVLSTDQVSEDVGRKFVSATNESKLDKITFNSGNALVFNLDDEAASIGSSKVVTDRITTAVQGGSTKITGITTTNGEFDVEDGRTKMGFMTSDATGITAITVSQSVAVDLGDAGAFFAGGSGETANRGGGSVSGDRILLIDSNGGMDEVADGSAGQFLQTDGSGSYSFADAGGGGGWHGSTSLIKVLPTEFMGNDLGRAIVLTRIEDDTANTLGVQINQSTGRIFAFNEIPTGYKATHVHVYTSSAVTNGVTVLHYNTTTGATSNSTTGNTNVNIDITDLTSSTTNALVIEVAPGSTSVFTYSAHITITSV